MELLLNLAWLLLALPAYWLWRRGTRRFSSLQCLLALGCMLVLLFPVISASDDLHAMRSEMEDSSVSKRAMRQAVAIRIPPGSTGCKRLRRWRVLCGWLLRKLGGLKLPLRAYRRWRAVRFSGWPSASFFLPRVVRRIILSQVVVCIADGLQQ